MQLTNGVYTFPQTIERDGVENTINPAVKTSYGVILIDTGYPGLTDQIEANLGAAAE